MFGRHLGFPKGCVLDLLNRCRFSGRGEPLYCSECSHGTPSRKGGSCRVWRLEPAKVACAARRQEFEASCHMHDRTTRYPIPSSSQTTQSIPDSKRRLFIRYYSPDNPASDPTNSPCRFPPLSISRQISKNGSSAWTKRSLAIGAEAWAGADRLNMPVRWSDWEHVGRKTQQVRGNTAAFPRTPLLVLSCPPPASMTPKTTQALKK